MRQGYFAPPTRASLSTLTMEEAAVMLGEMADDLQSIDNGLHAIKEAEDITSALTDYHNIVSIEPSMVDDRVAEVMNAAAATSMQVDPNQVQPLVLESFTENVKNIYQTILELLKKLWEHTKSFFAKVFDYRGYLRGRVEKLRSKLGQHTDQQVVANPTIKLSVREAAIFAVEGKELMGIDSYRKVMDEIYRNVGYNFQRGPAAIDELGKTFIRVIETFEPEAAHNSVKASLVGLVQPVLWKYFDAFKVNNFAKSTLEATQGTAVAVSPPLAGRCKVRLSWGKAMNDFFVDRDTQQPIFHVLDGLAEAKLTLVSSATPDAEASEVTTPAFSYAGLDAAMKMVEKGLNLIDMLEKNQATKMRDYSTTFATAVQAKQTQLQTFLNEHREGDIPETNEEAQQTFNSLVKLPNVYANMAAHPINEIVHRTIGTFGVVLNMVEKSMPMYKLNTDMQAA